MDNYEFTLEDRIAKIQAIDKEYNLQEQLDIMDTYLPNEKKQCEILWKPVYDEYRRLGYRLRKQKERQMTIEDFINFKKT